MARKPLFQTLVEGADADASKVDPAPQFPSTRPMQKMKTSLIELQKSSVQDIPLDHIDEFQFHDRIDIEEDLDDLVSSFATHGQEVPIKVRPIEGSNRYQVIIGRRRCAAARRLGWDTIKAMVQEKGDIEALASMLAENSARRETSYIGRAMLYARVIDSGVKQSDLATTLGVSRGHISQSMRTYHLIGEDLIRTIGDAVGAGRSVWDPIGEAMQTLGLTSADAAELVDTTLPSSKDRLMKLQKLLKKRLLESPPTLPDDTKPKKIELDLWDGRCQLKRSGDTVTLKRLKDAPEDMLDFIADRIPELLREYKNLNEGG